MNRLTDLQSEILRRFFAARDEFFLTGDAALVGFYLGHRETHDLDLFTEGAPLGEGERTLRAIAGDLDLVIESLRRDPAFQRFVLRHIATAESLVVDLVRDDAPQLGEKRIINGIRIDSVEEILANKLCAVVARGDTRSCRRDGAGGKRARSDRSSRRGCAEGRGCVGVATGVGAVVVSNPGSIDNTRRNRARSVTDISG